MASKQDFESAYCHITKNVYGNGYAIYGFDHDTLCSSKEITCTHTNTHHYSICVCMHMNVCIYNYFVN